MASPVKMPRQGQSVESCILTEWYMKEGEKVEKGDLLFAYETDKAAFEEEAGAEGVLLACFFEAGDEVPVLANVAVIGEEGEDFGSFSPDDITAHETQLSPGSAQGPENPEVGESSGPLLTSDSYSSDDQSGRVLISPRARKLACEKRVVIHNLNGSGPGGRIIEADIQEEIRKGRRLTPLAMKKLKEEGLEVPCEGIKPFGKISSKGLLEAKSPLPVYQDEALSNVRKLIAGAMHASLRNSAQLTHHMGANATAMLALRKKVKAGLKEGFDTNITLNDMLCFACVRALKMHPEVNAHFLGESIRKFKRVNLGIAVDTDRGLLVPALPFADDFSLTELSSHLKSLAADAREGKISPDLLAPEAASFTISNLGNYGVEMFTPVINLPQVAILGVNTILQRPAAMPDGSIGFQPYIGLSLTYDHRAIDGGPATLFLASIKNHIESLSEELL